MSDLESRLAALRAGRSGDADPDVVAADVRRGHAALARRTRRRRTGLAVAATVAVVAAGSLTYVFAGDDDHTQVAAPSPAVSVTHRPPSSPAPSVTHLPASSSSAAPGLQLVAWHGDQLPGYTVTRVPRGYVLQGISGSVLDIAEKGDHSSLDTFSNKLVVMLNDHPPSGEGTHVTVDGHPGYLRNDGTGVQTLEYDEGGHHVAIQSWSNIKITPAQLVRFAEGVTVLPNAQEGHG